MTCGVGEGGGGGGGGGGCRGFHADGSSGSGHVLFAHVLQKLM